VKLPAISQAQKSKIFFGYGLFLASFHYILVDDKNEAIERALTSKLGDRIVIQKRSVATVL